MGHFIKVVATAQSGKARGFIYVTKHVTTIYHTRCEHNGDLQEREKQDAGRQAKLCDSPPVSQLPREKERIISLPYKSL